MLLFIFGLIALHKLVDCCVANVPRNDEILIAIARSVSDTAI